MVTDDDDVDLEFKYGEHQDDEKESEKNFFVIRFDCVAEGNPAPSVFWTKEVR